MESVHVSYSHVRGRRVTHRSAALVRCARMTALAALEPSHAAAENLLIISVGDSYASGEGAPDQ